MKKITNNEDKDWVNCKLELNSGILKGGYVYKAKVIPAKDALIVPFREFTKGDTTSPNLWTHLRTETFDTLTP